MNIKLRGGGGEGEGGSPNHSGPSLDPPEILFSGCAPRGNRMEIVLGIKVVFTNTFNDSMTGRKDLNKTVNIIHFQFKPLIEEPFSHVAYYFKGKFLLYKKR